jgi:hypothetical protein
MGILKTKIMLGAFGSDSAGNLKCFLMPNAHLIYQTIFYKETTHFPSKEYLISRDLNRGGCYYRI